MYRTLIYVVFMCCTTYIYSQQWEPMDYGIECMGTNWPSIWDIEINPQTDELFIGGAFSRDGHDNVLKGTAKWDNQNNKWIMPDTALQFGQVKSMFNFNNKLYIAGNLEHLSSGYVSTKMNFFDNDGWHQVLGSPSEGYVYGSRVIDGKVYLVGTFDLVDSNPTSGFAIFDGNNFDELFVNDLSGFSMMFNDVIKWRNGIYVAGKNLSQYAGGYQGVAIVDDNGFHPIHLEFTGDATGQDAFVIALDVYQDNLIIGGEFRQYHGYTSNNIQYFDGEEMHSLGGMAPNRRVWDVEVYNGELYVVGDFNTIIDLPGGEIHQSIPAYGIAKWDGEKWTSLNTVKLYSNSGVTGMVTTMEIHQDTIYIAGNFCSRGGDLAFSSISRAALPQRPIITELNDFNVYPNPSPGNIIISFDEALGVETFILLYNSLGQLIYETSIPKWGKKVEIDSSQLSQGMYFVNAQMGDQELAKKVFKY